MNYIKMSFPTTNHNFTPHRTNQGQQKCTRSHQHRGGQLRAGILRSKGIRLKTRLYWYSFFGLYANKWKPCMLAILPKKKLWSTVDPWSVTQQQWFNRSSFVSWPECQVYAEIGPVNFFIQCFPGGIIRRLSACTGIPHRQSKSMGKVRFDW